MCCFFLYFYFRLRDEKSDAEHAYRLQKKSEKPILRNYTYPRYTKSKNKTKKNEAEIKRFTIDNIVREDKKRAKRAEAYM